MASCTINATMSFEMFLYEHAIMSSSQRSSLCHPSYFINKNVNSIRQYIQKNFSRSINKIPADSRYFQFFTSCRHLVISVVQMTTVLLVLVSESRCNVPCNRILVADEQRWMPGRWIGLELCVLLSASDADGWVPGITGSQ